MTNRINQLVLNTCSAAKLAAKQGFESVAGNDLGGMHPTASPSVGRPLASSGSQVHSPTLRRSTERATRPARETEGNTPGMRTLPNGWRVTSQRGSEERRVAYSRLTGHDTTGHHDYPSHDVRHDDRRPTRMRAIATNGK